MIPRPAQYLLRFDDLCPTIPPARWEQFRKLVEEFRICPILAVVPDNQDPDLNCEAQDPSFWADLRTMEAAGAVIAAHGYRHVCLSRGRSLLNLHRKTEFAGVDFKIQRDWIRAGLGILRGKGLNPRMWVAPRHGFDHNTLRALRDMGVEYISDGFARVPFHRHGVTWIPQQLWSPLAKTRGLWTICLHPYVAGASEVERLRSFLQQHGAQFTSFDRVLKEFPARSLGLGERVYESMALWRVERRYRRRRQKKRSKA